MRLSFGYRLFRPVCVGLFVAGLALAGCSNQPDAQSPTKTEPSAKRLVVGVSLCRTDGAWRAQMRTDIEAAAEEHPNLRFLILDAQNDAAKQQAQLDAFLNRPVNLVMVSPKDPQAVTEPVAKLTAAGIPVVVLDRAVIGDKYSCFVAADPKQIGTMAGKWLATRFQGKGNIAEIEGPVDSLQAQDIHEAFRKAMRDPGYHFVLDECVDPPTVDAGKLMADTLSRVEMIDAVFAYDDAAAKAAYDAAKAVGRERNMIFVGVGGVPAEGARYVSERILAATFLYPTGGTEAVDAAVKLLQGELVPKRIVPPTRALVWEDVRPGDTIPQP
jgi:ribose transport system substrate-binding protein